MENLNEIVKEDFQQLKYEILTRILRENDIEFDQNIKNYDELAKILNETLPQEQIQDIFEQEKAINEEIKNFITDIRNNGQITPELMFEKINGKVLTPIAKSVVMIGISRAIFDAMLFLPVQGRVIVGVAEIGRHVFKGVKGFIDKKRQEKSEQLDKIVDKMQVKEDKDGKIIQEKFLHEELEIIKKYLNENKIEYNENSYIDIINGIKSLKNEEKINLLKEIATKRNDGTDINHEMSKERKKFKISKFFSNIGKKVAYIGGIVLLSNLDKEFGDLINPTVPENITEEIFKNRTGYKTKKLLPSKPFGMFTAFATSLAVNIIGGTKAIISEFKQSAKHSDVEFDSNKKVVFEVIRNRLLALEPERAKEIEEISTISELKNFSLDMPKEKQRIQNDYLSKLQNIMNKNDNSTKTKELAKMLKNSAFLAADSMAIYQALLFLKGLPLTINQNSQNNSNNLRPEPETVPATDIEQTEVFGPEYKPVFGPELKPEFGPEYKPVFGPEYKPEFGPEFKPEFGPEYKPEFGPEYQPEFGPEYQPASNKLTELVATGSMISEAISNAVSSFTNALSTVTLGPLINNKLLQGRNSYVEPEQLILS